MGTHSYCSHLQHSLCDTWREKDEVYQLSVSNYLPIEAPILLDVLSQLEA